jgi:nucleoside-diphosphate-sugar epimerase
MQDSRVFVTGATGFIGQKLVHRLLESGVGVRILTRRDGGWPGGWTGRVDVRRGDLSDRTALSRQLAGCQTVFHLAGELRDRSRMQAVNVVGTANVLAACEAAGVQNVLHLSSVGVIGARGAGLVDEATPCSPRGDYERSKHEAEKLAVAWSERTTIPLAALRPTTVFGDGLRTVSGPDSMLAWLRAIQAQRFIFFDRDAIANYVYSGDVAEACQIAGSQRLNGVFIVADCCPLAAFVAAAARAMGTRAPRRFVPTTVGYAAALVMQAGAMAVGARSPLTVNRVRVLSTRTQYSAERLRSLAGWSPTTGWEAGIGLTVAWYRSQGFLP